MLLSIKEAKRKAAAYCAYQERSIKEVREKLTKLDVPDRSQKKIIEALIKENFINETRYAQLYATGKFRLKKWGRAKIIEGLRKKDISEENIQIGLKEIEEEDYIDTLRKLIHAKHITEKNPLKYQQKMFRYLQSKGYESYIIWQELND